MKKYFFILIVTLLFCCSQVQAIISTPPWWAGKLDPTKDTIVTIWVETGKVVYDNNEIILFEVSFSDPKGLNGNICLLSADGKPEACQILPWNVIGQSGAQAEFPILERTPGKYKFQAKFKNGGLTAISNEIEITINSTTGPFPAVNSTKTESAVIDGYEFSWRRTYVDGIWGKPMPLGEPHPFRLAPYSGKNPTTWGSFKKGDPK